MKSVLKDRPAIPFRIPAGIRLVRVDHKTGERVRADSKGSIIEAFKTQSELPEYGVSRYLEGENEGYNYTSDPNNSRTGGSSMSGTGGLY